MPFNTSGAASGAAAGASFGPWGALAGGVLGGFMGGSSPSPTMLGPAQGIGGSYSPYGTVIQDPRTGAVYQFGGQAQTSPQELYNQAMMSALMGEPVGGAGSQSEATYQDARSNLLAQMQAADQSIHDANSLNAANAQKDRLQAQLAQLDAAHQQAIQVGQNNPLTGFLNQNKYNTLADILNQNATQGAQQQQQALANRGLAGSTLSDMTARQAALQRGSALGSLLQNVGQQDLSTRMGLLGQLQGQNETLNQERLANAQMGLGYGQFGAGLGQNFANAQMGINATNVGLQNAGNWAQFGQQQRNAGDLGSAIGSVDWTKMFSGSAPSAPSSTQGFAGPAPAYNPGVAGSAPSNYGAGFGNYMTNLGSSNPFQVNMSAAGKGR